MTDETRALALLGIFTKVGDWTYYIPLDCDRVSNQITDGIHVGRLHVGPVAGRPGVWFIADRARVRHYRRVGGELTQLYVPDPGTTAHTVTARRAFRCWGYRCSRWVSQGEDYARHVAFPGHDANNSRRPLVLKLCERCHTEHDRPMPPRRAGA